MNPSTAFATVLADELVRCGVREAVLAPGSRSAPLAFALAGQCQAGRLRLHVRIDERSAAFLALGLAKAGGRPAVLVCTSGTAAAEFHPAVIEADESGVPLIVLTADRPPELRGTGAAQTIDQVRLYGPAVRWYCDAGVAEARPGMAAYWRSLACRAWAQASGAAGTFPGPVQVNVPLRDPLVPSDGPADPDWPESLAGRPGGAAWTGFGGAAWDGAAWGGGGGEVWAGFGGAAWAAGSVADLDSPEPAGDHHDSGVRGAGRVPGAALGLDWTERGVVVCGDGDYDAGALVALAEAAGWPVLAEPSSNARHGRTALARYEYLLATPAFAGQHRPDLIVSAGRPGLSRGQLALLHGAPGAPPARHIVLAQGPGRWADPARTATAVAAAVGLNGPVPAAASQSAWLTSWQRADAAAGMAADTILDEDLSLSEPRLARDLAAALPSGTLLWAASSLPVRDLDLHMPAGRRPGGGPRVLASRGASGIDGLVSSAIGAALAHQVAGGGPAVALLGDLAFLHDMPGLILGPDEPRPDLCLIVVNNDGGGIFSQLEQAAFPAQFERLFGTPHGADLRQITQAANLPYTRLEHPGDLAGVLAGRGLRVAELRADRSAGTALRARLTSACQAAIAGPVSA